MKKEKKSEYKPSLLKAIIKTFGPWYAFLGIFTFFEECVIRVFQPLFMGNVLKKASNFLKICMPGWMIEYFTPNSSVTLSEAYLYGSGVVLMAAVYTFTHHPYFFGVMYTGMKVS